MLASLALWHIPSIHQSLVNIDYKFTLILNASLENKYSALFWAFFNKKFERSINAVIILGINFFYIFITPKGKRLNAVANVLLLWLYMEVCITFTRYVFFDLLEAQRYSPSLVIDSYTRLSIIFNDYKVKDASTSSFPSGHAFAMFYWLFFSAKFMNKRLVIVGVVPAIFFSLPRLFSGAHWLTDVIFAIFLADFVVNIVTSTPLYNFFINLLERFLFGCRNLYGKYILAYLKM